MLRVLNSDLLCLNSQTQRPYPYSTDPGRLLILHFNSSGSVVECEGPKLFPPPTIELWELIPLPLHPCWPWWCAWATDDGRIAETRWQEALKLLLRPSEMLACFTQSLLHRKAGDSLSWDSSNQPAAQDQLRWEKTLTWNGTPQPLCRGWCCLGWRWSSHLFPDA